MEIPDDQIYSPVSATQSDYPVAASTVDLQPELRSADDTKGAQFWTTLDLLVTLNAIKLHLYDELATSEQSLKDHGITRLALNGCTTRFKMVSDGASEAEVVLKSFTMSNTRPGNTKFREIIPAAHHNRNQVMVLYSSAGGSDNAAMVVMTVDSPQVIFSVEPIIGLLEFFMSAFNGENADPVAATQANTDVQPTSASQTSSTLNFRLDLHDVSVSVLENDTDPNTRAIRLGIRKVFLSQQVHPPYKFYGHVTNVRNREFWPLVSIILECPSLPWVRMPKPSGSWTTSTSHSRWTVVRPTHSR